VEDVEPQDERMEPEVLLPDAAAADASEDEEPVVELPSELSHPSTRLPALSGSRALRSSTTLDRFLAAIQQYPLLTPEEEHALAVQYFESRDRTAGRKLVIHNLRLVVKMAYRYRRAWASLLDLIQEGNLGLMEAVGRYDPFRGAKFSTYATYWIRAYILRYILEHARNVRVVRSRAGRKLYFQLNRERERLRAQGIEPGPKLLAERLGVNEADLEEAVQHMGQAEVRLDAPRRSEDPGGATLLDSISSEAASPEAAAFRREFSDGVGQALSDFSGQLTDPKEVAIWREHLLADDPAPLSALGKRYGVSKQRMGQIATALRARLKVHLLERLGDDIELGFELDAD
jgi:RNA polymerase sigma-32 factor